MGDRLRGDWGDLRGWEVSGYLGKEEDVLGLNVIIIIVNGGEEIIIIDKVLD